MICPICRKKNEDGVSYCKYCGAPVGKFRQVAYPESIQKPEPPVSNNDNKKNKLLIVITVLLAVLIIAIFASVCVAVYIHNRYSETIDYNSEDTTVEYREDEDETEKEEEETEEDFEDSDEEDETSTKKQTTTAKKPSTYNGLSRDKQYEINIFISNFAEIDFEDFYIDDYNDGQIIDFSMLHNYVNNFGGINYSPSDDLVVLSADSVQKNAKRFFGTSVYCSETDLVNYDESEKEFFAYASSLNNHNSYSMLDFNKHYSIAVIDSMKSSGGGTHSVEFTVYKTNYSLSDNYYNYFPSDAHNDSTFTEVYTGSAVVSDYYVNGQNKYQLISYTTSG